MFRIMIILMSFMLTNSILASTVSEMYCNNQMVIGLSAGPTWTSGNEKQTFNLQPDIVKTYTADDNHHTFPSAELFLGWQSHLSLAQQPVLSQLGISIAAADHANLSGDIWEDADPTFDNFNYTYKVNHAHVAVKGRLIGNDNFIVEPYISASVGIGFNRAYDFTIDPKISEEVPAPAFQSNTTTTFSYTLGIGIQKSFTPQLQAAIGYEFADWGKTQLSRAPGQTLNQGLTLDHLYAHQLQLSLFFLV